MNTDAERKASMKDRALPVAAWNRVKLNAPPNRGYRHPTLFAGLVGPSTERSDPT